MELSRPQKGLLGVLGGYCASLRLLSGVDREVPWRIKERWRLLPRCRSKENPIRKTVDQSVGPAPSLNQLLHGRCAFNRALKLAVEVLASEVANSDGESLGE